jgi:hypothetical protein
LEQSPQERPWGQKRWIDADAGSGLLRGGVLSGTVNMKLRLSLSISLSSLNAWVKSPGADDKKRQKRQSP